MDESCDVDSNNETKHFEIEINSNDSFKFISNKKFQIMNFYFDFFFNFYHFW